jgi:hypothetical protein
VRLTIVPYELRTHEERIREAQCRRKAQQGDYEQKSFLERKRINTNKNHSGYGYYEQRPCQAQGVSTPSAAVILKPRDRADAPSGSERKNFLPDEEAGAAHRQNGI